ncbi:hypothetical protein KBTX_04364 [wastewater metagenome]|uniref:Uncharacterized protein n=2 Tax=unclassified sequences TaxID=12908 RepID=A0A5B8RHB8_9ZZZZ|nr:hypothetical protein KBTEX_04364 [uncultured organism]
MGSRSWMMPNISATSVSSSSTPSARAAVAVSRMSRFTTGAMRSSWVRRWLSQPVTAEIGFTPLLMMSLRQSSRRMSGVSCTGTPAACRAAIRRGRKADAGPSGASARLGQMPAVTCPGPVASITPGAVTWVPMRMDRPPITRSAPRASASTGSLSTPFCSETTGTAPAPGHSASAAAIAGVDADLVASSTPSTPCGSSACRPAISMAATGASNRDSGCSTVRPRSRRASSCCPRAMAMTSWPACSSRAA